MRLRFLVLRGYPAPYRFQTRRTQTFPPAVRRRFASSMASTANGDMERVSSFWFNRSPFDWMTVPAGLDEQCKSGFSDLVTKASRNELDDWAREPEACAALIVLLDQFPRNIYRGSSEAFRNDSKVGEIATRAIAQGFDKQVSVIKASAFYIPLMHQESLVSSIASACLYRLLESRCESELEREWVKGGIFAADQHVQLLERFGRYPARNAALGRENTKAEEEFLNSKH